MAEAVGQLTGGAAAVLGTRAVGASNMAIGIHTARQNSTPMVALLGQVERRFRGREAFQEVELATSFALVFERPEGVGVAAAVVGALLALVTWLSTALLQVPQHRRLSPDGVRALVTGSWLRTIAWTAHSAVVLAMLAAAAD